MRFHLFGLATAPVSREFCHSPFTALTYDMAQMIKAEGHDLILYGAPGSSAPCDEFVPIVSESHLERAFHDHVVDPMKMKWANQENSPEWAEYKERGALELRRRYEHADIALISYGYFQRFVAEIAPLHCEFCCGYSGIFTWNKVFPSRSWMHFLYGKMGKNESSPDWSDAVIHHYVDTSAFRYSADPGDYLLFLGRLNPDKGPDLAIRIARIAGLPLVIAGSTEDGKPDPDWLTAEAKGADVTFVGSVRREERNALLAGARALLSPIRWIEAFGMTTIESLACGTPVIGSDFGALPEIVEHGTTGFVCRDMSEFLEGVREAEYIKRSDCRDAVQRRFSLEAAWPQYERYFRRLTKRVARGWEETQKGTWRGEVLASAIRSTCNGQMAMTGAEVGTATGDLSQYLLRELPELSMLYMVDSYAVVPYDSAYMATGDVCASRTPVECAVARATAEARTAFASERRVILQSTSVAAAQGITDGSLDFVFIDAEHTADAVRSDLEAWFPKIRAGGVLAGHDYEHVGVKNNGVAKTVDAFAKAYGLTRVLGADWTWLIFTGRSSGPSGPSGPSCPSGADQEAGICSKE